MVFFTSRREKCYRQLWTRLGNKNSLSSIVRTLGNKGYTPDEISYAIKKVGNILDDNFNHKKREIHNAKKELEKLSK